MTAISQTGAKHVLSRGTINTRQVLKHSPRTESNEYVLGTYGRVFTLVQ